MHHMDFNEAPGEKAWWELHKDAACRFEHIPEAAPYKAAVIRPETLMNVSFCWSDAVVAKSDGC